MALIILFYIVAITVSTLVYRKYRYIGHLWLVMSFTIFLLGYLSRPVLLIFPNFDVFLIWTMGNIFLMAGILGVILVSLISQYDRLPFRSHFISALVGIIIGLLASRSNVTITNDANGINAKYSPIVSIFSLLLLLLFITYIFRPLIIKLRSDPSIIKKPHVILLIIAYTLNVLWVVLTVFTRYQFIREIRPLIFVTVVLLWSLSLLSNPLSLAFTTTKVQTVIVANKFGLPLVSVDMETGEEMDTTLLVGLLSAVKTSMESVVGDVSLKSIIFHDSLLFFMQGKHAILIFVLNGNISSNLELIGRYYILEFEEKYRSDLTKEDDTVYPDVFNPEIENIKQIMHEVYI